MKKHELIAWVNQIDMAVTELQERQRTANEPRKAAPMYLSAEQVMILRDLRDRLMGVANPNPITAEVLEVLDDIFKS